MVENVLPLCNPIWAQIYKNNIEFKLKIDKKYSMLDQITQAYIVYYDNAYKNSDEIYSANNINITLQG